MTARSREVVATESAAAARPAGTSSRRASITVVFGFTEYPWELRRGTGDTGRIDHPTLAGRCRSDVSSP
jgi:hypothetical protein